MISKGNLQQYQNFLDSLLSKHEETKLQEDHLLHLQQMISKMNDIQLRRTNLFLQKKIEEETPESARAAQIQSQIIEFMKKERAKLEGFSQDVIPRRFKKLYNRGKSVGSKIPYFPPNRIKATQKISAVMFIEKILKIKLYKIKQTAIRSLQTFGSSAQSQKLQSVAKGMHVLNERAGNRRHARAHFYHWRSKSSYTISSIRQNTSKSSFHKYLNNELSKPFTNLLHETEKFKKKAFHVINLVYKLQRLFTSRVQSSFAAIRMRANAHPGIRMMKIFTLRNIESILELRVLQQKLRAVRIWKSATHTMSLQMGRIHSRLKARLLFSMAMHLQPSLNLAQAMSRWKVKADKNIMKFAIAKFANNIKINPLTALWKLKGSLNDGERKRRKEEYLQKINRALTMLSGIMGMLIKASHAWGYAHIQSYAHKKRLAMKMLKKIEENFKNVKRIALTRWRDTLVEKDLRVIRTVMGNFVHDMRRNMLLAMYRWRFCALSMRMDYERRMQLATHKLDTFVKIKKEFLNIEAFHEIARENRKQALMEHIFLRGKTEIIDGVKILAIVLGKKCLKWKQTAFATLLMTGREEGLKHERALKKLVVLKDSGVREAFFNLKTLVAREHSKVVNQVVKRMFEVCEETLKVNTKIVFDTETEFKRKIALKVLSKAFRQNLREAFYKWKAATSTQHALSSEKKNSRGRAFQLIMNRIITGFLSDAFHKLHKDGVESEQVKTRVAAKILQLYNAKIGYYFDIWKGQQRAFSDTQKSAITKHFFELLSNATRLNLTFITLTANKVTSRKQAFLRQLFSGQQNLMKQAFYQWLLRCKDAKLQASKDEANQKTQSHRIYAGLNNIMVGKLQSAFNSIQITAHRRYCFRIVCDKANKRIYDQLQQKLTKWKLIKDAYSRDGKTDKLLGISSLLLSFKRWAFTNLKFAANDRKDKIREMLLNLQNASHARMSLAFFRWKQLLNIHSDNQQCQLTTSLLQLLSRRLRTSFEPIFARESTVKARKNAIILFRKLIEDRLQLAVYTWRINTSQKRVHDEALISQQQEAFKGLNKIFLRSNAYALATAIQYWKQSCKSTRLMKRAFYRLLNMNSTRLQRAFDIWRDVSKKTELVQSLGINKLTDKILMLYLRRLREGFSSLKNSWEEHNLNKRDFIRRLILACKSETQRAFNVWRLHTSHLQRIEACKSAIGLFNAMGELTNLNLRVVLKFDRIGAEKKNQIVKRFFSAFSVKLFQAFHQWHEYSRQEIEIEEKRNQKITQGIDKVSHTIYYNYQNLLRKAFFKLKENIKEDMLKKRVVKALVRTTQGVLWDAFNRWRDRVREFKAAEKQKTRGMLDLQLERIYLRALKKGFDPLKEEWMSAYEMKRGYVRKWVAVSQGKYKGRFEQWKEITQLLRDLHLARQTVHLLEVVSQAARINLAAVLQKDARRNKMIRVFRMLSASTNQLLRASFLQWRESVIQLRAIEENNRNLREQGAINLYKMTVYLVKKTQREAFRSIGSQDRQHQIMRKIMIGLSNTRHGSLLDAFQTWRRQVSTQMRDHLSGSNMLAKLLRDLYIKTLNSGWAPLREIQQEAVQAKQEALYRLIIATEDKQKVYWRRWAAIVRQERSFEQMKSLLVFFETVKSTQFNTYQEILLQKDAAEKRKQVIRIMGCAIQSKLSNTFEVWKGVCKQKTLEATLDELQRCGQLKKALIRILNKQSDTTREAFDKLKLHHSESEKLRQVLLALVQATNNKLSQAFILWKLHPKLSERQKPLHSVESLQRLHKIYLRQLRSGFSALQTERETHESLKHNVALLLIGEQRALLRQAFNKWTSTLELEKETEKFDQAARVVELLATFHKANVAPVLEQTHESDIRKLAVTKIISNSKQLLQEAFSTWHRFAFTGVFSEQYRTSRQQNAADKLLEHTSKLLDNTLRDAFTSLKANMKEQSVKKRFMLALLNTKFGQLHAAFQRWKNLPSKSVLQTQTNILQCIDVLNALLLRRMSSSFNQLKEQWIAANDIKINCLKKMLLRATRKEKIALNHWIDVCRSERRIEAFRSVKQFFEAVNYSVRCKLAFVLPSQVELHRKEGGIKLFVANLNNKMAQAFIIWKNVLYQERLKEELASIAALERAKKLMNPLLAIERRVKQESLAELKEVMLIDRRKNQAISRIFSNYFNKMHAAFEVLRNTVGPATFEDQDHANSIEKTLQKLLLDRVREAFEKIRFVVKTKKYVQLKIGMRIFVQVQGRQKDAMQIWREYTNQQIQLERIAAVHNLVQVVGATLHKNAIPVLEGKTVTKNEFSVLALTDLFEKLKLRREKEGLNALQSLLEGNEVLMRDALERLPGITMKKVRIAFLNWKNQAVLSQGKDVEAAARSIVKVLRASFSSSIEPIFKHDHSEYGKKMVMKRLFVNWSTRQSALFERWKQYVQKQRLLERALNFAKLVIACANNKQRLLRQALTRWKEKGALLQFITEHQDLARKTHISKAIDNLSLILHHQYQRNLFYGLNRLTVHISSNKIKTLAISRLQTMLNQRLADGLYRISSAAKRNDRVKRLGSAQALGAVLHSVLKSRLYNAFLSINEIKERQAGLRLALLRFNNRLHDIFQRWKMITAELKRQELLDQIQQKHKRYSGREKAFIVLHLLRRLFTQRLIEGFQGIETRCHKLKLLNLCFSRMGESAKSRERHAFEIWHNQTNQKIIKQFYDLIVLEKALTSYSNALRIAAFNAIKTSAIVNSEKMVIAALWKWKIFNTEAKYYNMQEIFERKTRGLLKLFGLVEGIYQVPTRWSFNKLYKFRLRQADIKSQVNYLALVMKQQLSRYLWQLKSHGQDQRLENGYTDQSKTTIAMKLSRIAILVENRALAKAFNTWYDEVNQDRHLQEKSRLVKRNYSQRQKGRTLSDWKSFMIDYEKTSTRRVKALTMTKLLVFFQINLCKAGFEALRDHHIKTTRQQHAIGILQWHVLGLSVRESFRRWAVLAKYGIQLDKTKIALMIKILNKQAKIILNEAFSKWRGAEFKVKLLKLAKILDKHIHRKKHDGFEVIAHQRALAKQKDRIRAVNRMIRINGICEQLQKYYAFKKWHDKEANPWKAESMRRIAKNSRINTQVAFWRLRDCVTGHSAFFSHVKMAKVKKIYHYVSKYYLLSLGRAFWLIERFGRTESFSRSMISRSMVSEDMRKSFTSNILPPSMTNQSISMAQQSVMSITKPSAQNALIDKGRLLALKMVLNKYDVNKVDRKERLTEAFKNWRRQTPSGINTLIRNLNKAIRPHDVDLIAKHGALELMVERIELAYQRQVRMAFNAFKVQLGMGDYYEDDDDSEREHLHKKNQELYEGYIQKTQDLNQVSENLSDINTRLTAMIASQFFNVISRRRYLVLSEAFHKIILRGSSLQE